MDTYESKFLTFGKAQWKKKKKLRDCMRFGWQIRKAEEVTTKTTSISYNAELKNEKEIEVTATPNTYYDTDYHVELYRYPNEIPKYSIVRILEFLYAVVGVLKVINCIFFPIIMILNAIGKSPMEMIVVMVLYIVISWNIGNLVQNILSKSSERIINKGWL